MSERTYSRRGFKRLLGRLEATMREHTEPTSYQLAILLGLQNTPHIYAGSVPAHVKASRRARNRQARISRRINRG